MSYVKKIKAARVLLMIVLNLWDFRSVIYGKFEEKHEYAECKEIRSNLILHPFLKKV